MADAVGELVACHEYDRLHWQAELPPGGRADCSKCGAVLYRDIPDSLNRALALYLSALLLFIIANSFPFLALEFGGRVESNLLISGGWALYEMGMGELGLLVFLTSIAFPLLTVLGMLYLLISLRYGERPPGMGPVWRLVNGLMPWSLLGGVPARHPGCGDQAAGSGKLHSWRGAVRIRSLHVYVRRGAGEF